MLNYQYWLKKETWSELESRFLLVGAVPYYNYKYGELPENYSLEQRIMIDSLYSILIQAVIHRKIKPVTIENVGAVYVDIPENTRVINPKSLFFLKADVLKWAIDTGRIIPEELFNWYIKFQSGEIPKQNEPDLKAEETVKAQIELLGNNPKYQKCFFQESLLFVVKYIFPVLTNEQREAFDFDSLEEYINDDQSIEHYDLIKELNFIGVDSSLVAELSESILRESEFYNECNFDIDIGALEEQIKNKINSDKARKAANAKHDKPGGSRDKANQIRAIWATGKYSTREVCAEEEYQALGYKSFGAARRALQNTPDQ